MPLLKNGSADTLVAHNIGTVIAVIAVQARNDFNMVLAAFGKKNGGGGSHGFNGDAASKGR
jgi:hypothetical protein